VREAVEREGYSIAYPLRLAGANCKCFTLLCCYYSYCCCRCLSSDLCCSRM